MKKAGGFAGINKEAVLMPTENSADFPTLTNGKQTQIQRKTNAEPTEKSDEDLLQTENQRKTNANPTENKEEVSDPNAEQTQNEECFVTAIGGIVNERGLDEKFISPFEHWPHEQAEAVKKVNRYFRCLLNSTLKLSGHRKIPAAELRDLANAYDYVLSSDTFTISGHPYHEYIIHLHRKLHHYYKCYRNNSRLRLVLKRDDKIAIIAMLHEIGNSVPLCKFSELFHAPNT